MSSRSEPKICPYPFARMEVRANAFVPCCHGWLTPEYHKLDAGSEPWNGPAAQELRRRILMGDFSLCRRDLCGVPVTTLANNEEHEAQLSEENTKAVFEYYSIMPASPSSICIVADPRCNLACPSCRKGHITTTSAEDRIEMEETEKYLRDFASTLEVVRFAGDGEVFFSPWKRNVLASLNSEQFPKLRFVELTTNGIFFDEDNYKRLMPGAQFIKRVTVSMDAGNEPTYQSVRGKDWARLLKNLEWMSELRQKKILRKFQINFTLRLANMESMVDFVDLGKRLGADSIKFMAFEPWHRMAVSDYASEAVHLPQHPMHHRLYQLWSQVRLEPRVRWALSEPQSLVVETSL